MSMRWVFVATIVAWGVTSGPEQVHGQDAVSGNGALLGAYATCKEAWGHWETLILDRDGFRHVLQTDISKRGVHTGNYELTGDRLVLHAEVQPPEGDDIRIDDPLPFDSLAYTVDTIGQTPVLWRFASSRKRFEATGELNVFGLLVRTGSPSEEVESLYCRKDLGEPFGDGN